jgi:hypothetical protein
MLYNAAGFSGVQERRVQHDKIHCGKEQSFSPRVQEALDYGQTNEKNAVSTLLAKILPVHFPDLEFAEVGSFELPDYSTSHGHSDGKCTVLESNVPLCLVSPDGVLLRDKTIKFAVEIKCPYFKKVAHREIPHRYIPQIEVEMASVHATHAIYVCYTPQTTTAFLCDHHPQYVDTLMDHLAKTFVESPKSKSVTAAQLTPLKQQTAEVAKSYQFLCEVKSICDKPNIAPTVPTLPTVTQLQRILANSVKYMEEVNQLHRVRATESVTFMLSNTDRCDLGQGHGCQIGYVLANKQNNIEDYKAVLCAYLDKLQGIGAHVNVVSFDGEFHQLLSYGLLGEPLTSFSFHRRFW